MRSYQKQVYIRSGCISTMKTPSMGIHLYYGMDTDRRLGGSTTIYLGESFSESKIIKNPGKIINISKQIMLGRFSSMSLGMPWVLNTSIEL